MTCFSDRYPVCIVIYFYYDYYLAPFKLTKVCFLTGGLISLRVCCLYGDSGEIVCCMNALKTVLLFCCVFCLLE